jgi:hypothetical protein
MKRESFSGGWVRTRHCEAPSKILLRISMMVETKQSVAVKRGDHSSRGVVTLCLCGEIASSAGVRLLSVNHLKRHTRNDGGES